MFGVNMETLLGLLDIGDDIKCDPSALPVEAKNVMPAKYH